MFSFENALTLLIRLSVRNLGFPFMAADNPFSFTFKMAANSFCVLHIPRKVASDITRFR